MLKIALRFFFLALLGGGFSAAVAKEPVSLTSNPNEFAYGTSVSGQRVAKKARDFIAVGEVVETTDYGFLVAKFGNGSVVTMGGGSVMSLENSAGFNFRRGAFHVALGQEGADEIRLTTPLADVALKRGGTVVIKIDPAGDAVVGAVTGEVALQGKSGGETMVAPGTIRTVSRDGAVSTSSVGLPSTLNWAVDRNVPVEVRVQAPPKQKPLPAKAKTQPPEKAPVSESAPAEPPKPPPEEKPAQVALAVPAAPAPAPAVEPIEVGVVEAVDLYAYGTPPQGDRTAKYPRYDIVQNELLETVPFGGLEAVFSDGTAFTLGSGAKMVIDEYVYDPASAQGSATFKLAAGAFHFVSGHMPKEGFNIDTPLATIGIRGTEVVVDVQPNGEMQVGVVSGRVSVTSKYGGSQQEVVPGQNVAVDKTGRVSQPRPGIEPTYDKKIDTKVPRAVLTRGQIAKEEREVAKAKQEAVREAAKAKKMDAFAKAHPKAVKAVAKAERARAQKMSDKMKSTGRSGPYSQGFDGGSSNPGANGRGGGFGGGGGGRGGGSSASGGSSGGSSAGGGGRGGGSSGGSSAGGGGRGGGGGGGGGRGGGGGGGRGGGGGGGHGGGKSK